MTVKYKALGAVDLLKVGSGREKRAINLVSKIQKGEEFQLMNGRTIKLINDPALVEHFRSSIASRNTRALNSIEFVGSDRRHYKLKDLAKTPEFGGKGAGSGTAKEDHALTSIRDQIQTAMANDSVNAIAIKIGNKTALVADARTTPGTPKSDFEFVGPDGKTAFWISHKAGTKAKDFQQYGGLLELDRAGTKYPEVRQFIEDVRKHVPSGGLATGQKYHRPLKDTRLTMFSLYGKNYSAGKASGVDDIDVLLQGDLTLVKSGKTYTIRCAHTTLRGQMPTGDYAAHLYVRVASDRTQYGVGKARFMISTKATSAGAIAI